MNPRHVLVACDMSDRSRAALRLGASLSSAVGAKLSVAHVWIDPFSELPDSVRAALFVDREHRERAIARDGETLREFVKAEIGTHAPRIHVIEGREPADRLLRLAREIGADLLCVGAVGRTGLDRLLMGSVALRLVRRAPIPVLVAE